MPLQLRSFLPLLCLVVCVQATGGQQPPGTVNLRPGAGSSQPGVPQVRVTVDRRRVRLGTESTFTVAPANIVHDRRYIVTLHFGDGRAQMMNQSQVTHFYRAVGTYTYAIDVKQRQAPPCNPRVTLSATPNAVAESQPVSFSAQLSERCPNIQYRFFYGDGSSSGWQTSPQTQHNYPRAGRYLAYVDINDGNVSRGGSPRRRVEVTRSEKLSVSLTVTPRRARAGQPVTFTAQEAPASGGARYQFNFGDGTRTLWQTDQRAQHTYKSSGRYDASVQVSQFLNNQTVRARSVPAVLTVRSAPSPTPDPRATPTPNSSPTPGPGPSPTPGSSPISGASPMPNGSPTPDGSASPNGSSSPDGSPTPPNGSSSPNGSPSNGTTSTTSGTPSNGSNVRGTSLLDPFRKRWGYLLIAALILLAIYQASGYLFLAQPTFAPYPDAGVAAVAHEKGAVPLGFELLLSPNVSAGDYSVSTDAPRLVTNGPPDEERQVLEI